MFVLRHSATAARPRVAVRWRRLNSATCAVYRTAPKAAAAGCVPQRLRQGASERAQQLARMHKRARAHTHAS